MAPKNSLSVGLTESVVFLRGSMESTVSGRRQASDVQPAMLRGLLTLTLVKPTKISSIEIELEGKSKSAWPEGARRIEVTEEHKILSASSVFFRASSGPSQTRRTASVGPGLAVDRDDDEREGFGGRDTPQATPQSPAFLTPAARRVSADASVLQRTVVSSYSDTPPPFPETPSPAYSPTATRPASAYSWRMASSPRIVEEGPSGGPLDALAARTETAHSSPHSSPPARAGLRLPTELSRPQSAASSVGSFQDTFLSRHASREDAPASSGEPSRSASRGHSLTPTSPALPSPAQDDARGRRSARFSFATVSSALRDAVKERVRSSSPHGRSPRDGSGDRTADRGRSRERAAQEGGKRKERSALHLLSGAFAHDGDETNSSGAGWKEFRKGTYTYPISFAIPSNSPPTLHCDYGSVIYRLKAIVHRPGTFTSKLTSTREVTLIACPGEDDLDETESVVVQREWETQMHYLIVISGRAFPIGSSVPVYLTFAPIAKVKIHRITAVLEERVEYYTQFKRVARVDPTKRFELLALRSADASLLPLASDVDWAASPLRALVDAHDASESVASLMGPGPWALHGDLKLPASCGRLHFTNRHRRSNIGIQHTLKIVVRVERGDDEFVDTKTGKRRLFDIVVQTPIHILSCRCNPEWTALPRYSSFATETQAQTQSCLCSIKRRGSGGAGTLSPITVEERTTHAGPSGHHHSLRMSMDASWPHAARPSLALSDTESLFDRNSQFARLVAGQESELGEAPPRYTYVPAASR